jgi:TPR repeat protein
MMTDRKSETSLASSNSSSVSRTAPAALAHRGMQDFFAVEQAEECYREGMALLHQERHESAITVFTRGLELNPHHVGIRLMLGVIYGDIRLPFLDYKAAFEHFSIAAGQGSDRAAGAVGLMYLKGEGVARNPQKAVFWVDKAARCGLPFFQWWLGRMYEAGIGAEQSDREAIFWYQQALVRGFNLPPTEMTDLQTRALATIEANEPDIDRTNLGLVVDIDEESDDDRLEAAQEPITVWIPETRDGSRLSALAVPYRDGKMTQQRFKNLLQDRLEELISAAPEEARHWLTGNLEYSPDLYTIASYNTPKDWPIQILMSDEVMIRLNDIDWDAGAIESLDPIDLPSIAQLLEQLAIS